MDYLTLLIMLTTAFAMVPFVGPAIVWIPVCLYLAINDQLLAATLLALWGMLVVGTIDNVVKAFVLHGQSQLHPLLALLSVLGGVQALGPIGIVVGPMVVAMLQTLLSILQRELVQFEQHKFVLSPGPGFGVRASEEPQSEPKPSAPETESSAVAADRAGKLKGDQAAPAIAEPAVAQAREASELPSDAQGTPDPPPPAKPNE